MYERLLLREGEDTRLRLAHLFRRRRDRVRLAL